MQMETIARVFPVKSKKDVIAFAKEIDEWPAEAKASFIARFGQARERWYFQKIDGKPHVISIAEIERPEGFADYAAADDEFTRWFLKRAKKLTGWSFKKAPQGPQSELIYELKP
jgi:hypothetical protein